MVEIMPYSMATISYFIATTNQNQSNISYSVAIQSNNQEKTTINYKDIITD